VLSIPSSWGSQRDVLTSHQETPTGAVEVVGGRTTVVFFGLSSLLKGKHSNSGRKGRPRKRDNGNKSYITYESSNSNIVGT
jgi:hypothetical protein